MADKITPKEIAWTLLRKAEAVYTVIVLEPANEIGELIELKYLLKLSRRIHEEFNDIILPDTWDSDGEKEDKIIKVREALVKLYEEFPGDEVVI